jgi:dipeptidyl aminopeptidase/acylaminoacyl peptidase
MNFKVIVYILLVLLAVLILSAFMLAQEKKSVTVEDCVGMRRIVSGEVKISPDGKQIAYLAKAPKLKANQNDYQLWVRDVTDSSQQESGKKVFSSTVELSGLTWLADRKRIALLMHPREPKSRILFIDSDTGQEEAVVDVPAGILGYSISATGETVAYTSYLERPQVIPPNQNPEVIARGYSIPFKYPEILFQQKTGFSQRYEVWVLWRGPDGKWERTSVTSTSSRQASGAEPPKGFDSVQALGLSPDGNSLVFVYKLDRTPQGWLASRIVQGYRQSLGINPIGAVVYNTRTHLLSEPLSFPNARGPIRWSDDSRAFVLLAAGLLGSNWEKQDAAANVDPVDPVGAYHVFAVDEGTRAVSEVLKPPAAEKGYEVAAWEHGNGEMIITSQKEKAFLRMKRAGQEWEEVSRVVPFLGGNLNSVTTNNGEILIGIHQAPTVPPDLFLYDVKKNKNVPLTDLNPRIRGLTLGDVEKVEWRNRYGGNISGSLIKPVGYEEGKIFPLVIMLTWPTGNFICDGHYATAFPPQPLANAGFLVLIFNVYNIYTEGAKQPEGPPAIREAETMVASVEAAVDFLAERGLTDKDNVGIIGFSRSSWKVDYLLTHSDFKFRAASSADGGIYNYGAYWRYDGWATSEYEAGYGGPPYGATLQNWLKGAPAFNAEKVQTPVLMEYTGGGNRPEPDFAYEFHTALNKLGKPVDLFFYPKGDHPLDTPFERVASLQRNVDWFRFWMQGYESKAPDYDPDQYIRWRELRKLQQQNEAKARAAAVN